MRLEVHLRIILEVVASWTLGLLSLQKRWEIWRELLLRHTDLRVLWVESELLMRWHHELLRALRVSHVLGRRTTLVWHEADGSVVVGKARWSHSAVVVCNLFAIDERRGLRLLEHSWWFAYIQMARILLISIELLLIYWLAAVWSWTTLRLALRVLHVSGHLLVSADWVHLLSGLHSLIL